MVAMGVGCLHQPRKMLGSCCSWVCPTATSPLYCADQSELDTLDLAVCGISSVTAVVELSPILATTTASVAGAYCNTIRTHARLRELKRLTPVRV